MILPSNWMTAAAREIKAETDDTSPHWARLAAIIEKHCPFNRDIAYIEAPSVVEPRRVDGMTEEEAAEILLGKPVKKLLMRSLSRVVEENLSNVVMFRGNVQIDLPLSCMTYIIMVWDKQR